MSEGRPTPPRSPSPGRDSSHKERSCSALFVESSREALSRSVYSSCYHAEELDFLRSSVPLLYSSSDGKKSPECCRKCVQLPLRTGGMVLHSHQPHSAANEEVSNYVLKMLNFCGNKRRKTEASAYKNKNLKNTSIFLRKHC